MWPWLWFYSSSSLFCSWPFSAPRPGTLSRPGSAHEGLEGNYHRSGSSGDAHRPYGPGLEHPRQNSGRGRIGKHGGNPGTGFRPASPPGGSDRHHLLLPPRSAKIASCSYPAPAGYFIYILHTSSRTTGLCEKTVSIPSSFCLKSGSGTLELKVRENLDRSKIQSHKP